MSCIVVKGDQFYGGKQGLTYCEGISKETAGATGLCLHTLLIPPHQRAFAHKHENHETAIFVVHGRAHTWFGDNLENHAITEAGDFFYIPANVPHLPMNEDDEPCFAVISRTDPNEQESVVMLPDLDFQWMKRRYPALKHLK